MGPVSIIRWRLFFPEMLVLSHIIITRSRRIAGTWWRVTSRWIGTTRRRRISTIRLRWVFWIWIIG
uniref:Uncharacterized protein n=1 Tax=Amphimedon queenslandica TaxID=400682 RepID=A0A1X7U3T5_AMPQE